MLHSDNFAASPRRDSCGFGVSSRHATWTRVAALITLAIGLFGCDPVGDAVSSATEGLNESYAVATDLSQATGEDVEAGTDIDRGSLTQVSVTFQRPYDGMPIGELAAAVRKAVATEFKQKPQKILLSFKIDPGPQAQSGALPPAAQHTP
jgi:hypothetical protein